MNPKLLQNAFHSFYAIYRLIKGPTFADNQRPPCLKTIPLQVACYAELLRLKKKRKSF